MGYRSEVAIMVDEKHAKDFRAVLVKSDMLEYADAIHEEKNGVTGISFTDIKWYSDYPQIAMIETFIDALDYDDFGFIRVGEDYEDVEVRGIPYHFGLEVHRDIYVPFD